MASHRTEALRHYENAHTSALKYARNASTRGEYPYLRALDEIIDESMSAGHRDLGLIDIPAELIIGTKTAGRKLAFAGNFMPLLERNTEFGEKWIALCDAHLGASGITDPISCFEYMGRFYVLEGNKRASVLKSYGARTIPGTVRRIIPHYSQDKDVQIYYEFMGFYELCPMYQVMFTQKGGYKKLQAALGMQPDQKWTSEEKRNFLSSYERFYQAFLKTNRENLPVTPGDALLIWLEVYSFSEIDDKTDAEIEASVAAIWSDVRLLANGQPISVSMSSPGDKEKSFLAGLFSSNRPLNAAFIYATDLMTSLWTRAHEQGRQYLEHKFEGRINTRAYLCGDEADETLAQAVSDGAQVIFATSPVLLSACRRIAASNAGVRVFVCALSVSSAQVSSYYCRIYEGKFIAGAVAGAMALDDRIGYLANYPILGVPAAVNAFALGAQLTNPRARVLLKWSCLDGSPAQEFLREGVRLLSGQDAAGKPGQDLPRFGTYLVAGGGLIRPLASPRWDWGIFYCRVVQALLDDELSTKRDVAINYWWGMKSGVVNVDLADNLPGGVRRLAQFLQDGICSGQIEPFTVAFKNQACEVINDGTRVLSPEEIMNMDYLVDNVDGEIPSFDQLMPRSRGLVRLLGIYRDSIAPETEEKQL